MKLFVLHLSDIHFEKENDYGNDNVCGIVNALKIDNDIEAVLVIVSGDITFSGYRRQYSTGWKFFKALRDKIREKYDVGSIEFAVVPGNHDLNCFSGSNTHEQIKAWVDSDSLDEHIEDECYKMGGFYYYANVLQCFTDKKS